MAEYYPVPGFHFSVGFNIPDYKSENPAKQVEQGKQDNDTLFQAVSGLDVSLESLTLKEGGLNTYEHKLPVRVKYGDLILKRGLLKDSEVINWCLQAFNMNVKPGSLRISLLNEAHSPLMSWNVVRAWPKKWAIAEMNAEQNQVLIETIEFYYDYFSIVRQS